MAASTSMRLTQSGACAACGFYPGTDYHPGCNPKVVRHFKRGRSRQARRDAYLSALIRRQVHHDNEVWRSL